MIDKLSSLSGGSKDSTLVARICRLLVEIIAYPMTNAEDDLKETTFFRIKAAFSALEARNKTIKPNIPVEKSLDF